MISKSVVLGVVFLFSGFYQIAQADCVEMSPMNDVKVHIVNHWIGNGQKEKNLPGCILEAQELNEKKHNSNTYPLASTNEMKRRLEVNR